VKFGCAVFKLCERTDRQTHTQTDMLITILRNLTTNTTTTTVLWLSEFCPGLIGWACTRKVKQKLIWISWSKRQWVAVASYSTITYGAVWCHCHSLRLVLPFWYRLTWVIPDKIQRAVKRLCVCVCYGAVFSFSALTLLVGRQEEHLACKKFQWWGAGVIICLEQGEMICIWSSWCHCHPIISLL